MLHALRQPVGANQPPSGTAATRNRSARGWFAHDRHDRPVNRDAFGRVGDKGVPAGRDFASCDRNIGRPAGRPLRGAHAGRLDFDTALRAGSIPGGRCSSRWRSFSPKGRDCSVRSAGPTIARRTMPVWANQPPIETAARRTAAARGWFALVAASGGGEPVNAAICRNTGVPAGSGLGSWIWEPGLPADTPRPGAHGARLDFDTALRAGSITGGRCSSRWRSFG